jgi:predicted RNA-binding Zn-ribbon protein involved in translation (DUF1610 family)
MDELENKGVCIQCRQTLVQEDDRLKCPVCGESVKIGLLQATMRLRVPYPALAHDICPPKRRKSFMKLWNRSYRK